MLLLLCIALLPACRDEPAVGPAGNGVIAGTVTSLKTGRGMSGVIVALLALDELAATTHTDAAGQFDFGGVAAGTYTVRITGFEITGIDPRFEAVEPVSRTVVAGQSGSGLVFTIVGLVPPRVTGEVRCAGTAVADARLRVIGGNADVTVSTNVQGRYAALDLMPGHYAVIPVGAPCQLDPSYHALELLPGQSAQADFSG